MTIKTIKIWSTYGLFTFLAAFFIQTAATAADVGLVLEPPVRVTIKGSIANIDEIGPYIVNGSFLQVYPCDITGQIQVQTGKDGKTVHAVNEGQKFYLDKIGRLVPASGLDRTVFPDFGFFSFHKIKGLTPGECYKICVLMLDKPYPGLVPVTGADGKVKEIVIPEAKTAATPREIVIDLTRETLLVPPDPANLPKETVKKKARPAKPLVGDGFWD